MKQTILAFVLTAIVLISKAQAPAGYYNAAAGKTGAELKTALYNIIKGHNPVSYSAIWNAFYTTDKKDSGKVWDMYSDIPGGTPPYEYNLGSDQGSSSSTEGCCYNREHSFPKSWFNNDAPMDVDIFHIYPTDVNVNNKRSNLPYGTVNTPTWTSMNGSKIGPCSAPGYTGVVFEPIDEYKGDFARTYFYMATRYENVISTWHSNEFNGEAVLQANSFPVFETWILNLFINWNASDPVSQKEINRNNAVYALQKNRNPFIDHPEYANQVWVINTGVNDEYSRIALQVYPNPVSDMCTVTLPADFNQQNTVFTVYSSTGNSVFAPATVSGDKAVLSLENIPSGFYLVRLTNGNNSMMYQARIIKK